jgi:alkylhydroperoxidase family enzyme
MDEHEWKWLAAHSEEHGSRLRAVPDAIWAEAARHHDESGLAALVVAIASINAWNRLNVTTRQVVGVWTG